MKLLPVKPTKRTDWANYIDPEDQEIAKNERRYKISRVLDALVNDKGQVALMLHNGHDYMGDTILSEIAKGKLAFVLMKASGKSSGKGRRLQRA